MQGMQFHMFLFWGVLAAAVAVLVLMIVFLSRRAPSNDLLVAELASGRPDFHSIESVADGAPDVGSGSALETIFILPDISGYTRFMTGSQFSFGHAQHIVFSLINAMIGAATRTVELSKLEGDAALF